MPTGELVSALWRDDEIRVWNYSSGKLIRSLNSAPSSEVIESIWSLAVFPSGELVSAIGERIIKWTEL